MFSFLDFCSGIGAGRLGLERNDFKCLGFSEINKNSIKTYSTFFPNNKDEEGLGDLTKIDIKNIPNIDLFIAGFPCQSFSINGKRQGFKDERGQIIFSIVKILKEKNIKYFILENVKGLVNINKGKTLQDILKLLDNVGYNVFYKVLNTLDYGLPQSRERVYFVGIRKDLKNNFFLLQNTIKNKKYDLSKYLINNEEKYIFKNFNTLEKYLNNKYNNGKYTIKDLCKKEFQIIDTRQSDIRFYDGYIPTLRTGRSGILYVKNGILRTLSGKESLFFQGFTKEYYDLADNISNTLLLQQTGNAMSVNVIYEVARQLKEIMKKNEK